MPTPRPTGDGFESSRRRAGMSTKKLPGSRRKFLTRERGGRILFSHRTGIRPAQEP